MIDIFMNLIYNTFFQTKFYKTFSSHFKYSRTDTNITCSYKHNYAYMLNNNRYASINFFINVMFKLQYQ